MKKVILFIATVLSLGLASCNEPTVSKSDLPIEVVNLKDAAKYDTVLYISTEKKMYQFSKDREYIGAYYKESDALGAGFVLGFILGVVVVCIIGGVLSSI